MLAYILCVAALIILVTEVVVLDVKLYLTIDKVKQIENHIKELKHNMTDDWK